jgi:uncharacterized protein Yka (UPF0111/DUF47 family)
MSERLPWLLPSDRDLLALLRTQADVTIAGLRALVDWADGQPDAASRVREAEHDADEWKREVRKALVESFTTPLDPEDLYEMSQHLDEVINGAKDAVREAEVMALAPDEHVAAMAGCLVEGTTHLAEAFARLGPDGRKGPAATDAADAAVKSQRALERIYRQAMSTLVEQEDLREVMGRRELYRRFSRIGDSVIQVAERVWYATVKQG